MKISAISQIYNNNLLGVNKKTQVSFKHSVDTFERINSKSLNDIFYEGSTFKIDSYKALTQEQKEILLKKIPYQLKFDVERNYEISKKFKESLDEKYGENNYIFECIGTSPAGIGRFLEFSGIEVHYLPISALRKLVNASQLILYAHQQGIDKYGDFLASQGIKKGMEKETDKHILFYDYTESGTTLNTFKDILSEFYGVNVKDKKIEFRSLNSDLKKFSSSLQDEKEAKLYIDAYLSGERIGDYTGVPHLRVNSLDYVKFLSKSKKPENARLFNFYTMYLLEQEGLLKENLANKNSI